jgi:protein involved in sex pheromone biosynthesis
MQDSNIATNGGKGDTAEKKLTDLKEKWGIMPDKDRAKALQEVLQEFPPRFRPIIEDYFKQLSQTPNR